MRKLAIYCLFGSLISIGGWLYAQSGIQVYENKQAKLSLLIDYPEAWPIQLTQDKTYTVIAALNEDFGFIYNLKTNKIDVNITNAQPAGMSNDTNIYIANIDHDDGVTDRYTEGFLVKHGERVKLEGLNAGIMGGGGVDGISADGSKIVGVTDSALSGDRHMYFAAIWDGDGKFIKALPSPFGDGSDGTSAIGMTPNGRIIYGYAGSELIQRSPAYWVDEVAFSPSDDVHFAGEIAGANQNLMAVVGHVSDKGLIYYHSADGKGKRVLVEPLPNFQSSCTIMSISDDSVAVGYSSADFTTREALIHTPIQGTVSLKAYLQELYGLQLSNLDLLQATHISEDGKMILGYTPDRTAMAYVVFIIELGEQILPVPKNLSAVQDRTSTKVVLRWTAPMTNGEEVIGYNIYSENQKLNSEPITALRYVTDALEAGVHKFYAKTVYKTSGESDTSFSTSLNVVSMDGCLPIKNISNTVTYNNLVTIDWDLPSAEVSSSANAVDATNTSAAPKGIGSLIGPSGEATEALDILEIYDLKNQQFQISRLGDFYYTSKAESFEITQYDLNFNLITAFNVPNLNAVGALTAGPNNYLYVVTGVDKKLYIVDVENKAVTDYFEVKIEGDVKLTHITYIPELNENKGGFELGSYTRSFFVDLEGNYLSEGFVNIENVLGTAFHNGLFYAFEAEEDRQCILNTYDMKNKERIGSFNVLDIPEIFTAMTTMKSADDKAAAAGGICVSEMGDGTFALASIIQGVYVTNHLALFEIEKSPSIKGYNIFRNGEKLNDTLLSRRKYHDHPGAAGKYTYHVQSVNTNGCNSDTVGYYTNVIIAPYGDCAPVKSLSAKENNESTILSYALPDNGGDKVVGFNIFRDNELLVELHPYFKYTDVKPSMGKHTYRVEAFFDNGCGANDSVTIDINGLGNAMAPSLLRLNSEKNDAGKTYSVNAKWDAPYYEAPTEARFGAGVCGYEYALPMGTEYTALIGWDSALLTGYKDFVLVGMQVFMTAEVNSFHSVVLLNNAKAYNKLEGRIKTKTDYNIFFDTVFPMNQPTSVEVGYTIAFEAGTRPSGLDMEKAVSGYGDIFTFDFKEFGNLKSATGQDNNWCIAGLVARYRDLEAAGNNWQKDKNFLKTLKTVKVDQKATQLLGFNIYRDDTKLNSALLTEFSFVDPSLEEGEYDYSIGAVYASGEEIKSDIKTIEVGNIGNEISKTAKTISFYPNPAVSQINIDGEFTRMSVVDLKGKEVMVLDHDADAVSLSGLTKGVYVLRFTLPNKQIETHKLIIQ